MSRTAAATTAGRSRTLRRPAAPPLPRRVSGPAGPPRRDPNDGRVPRAQIDSAALAYPDVALPRPQVRPQPRRRVVAAPRPQRLAYGGVAIASRVAGVALDVSASRAMDRLVRSRVWIGIIAFGLIGIVATQVSLLKLNAGISRAVQTTSTLERSNAGMRREISSLSNGERIEPLAEAKGYLMPAPADVRYVSARRSGDVARRAAQRMTAPDPTGAGLAGAVTTPGLETIGPAATTTTAATPASTTGTATPAAGTPATSAPATTAPATTAPATTAPAVAQTAPAAPVSGAPATAAAVAAPTGTNAGGATTAPIP